MKKLQKKKEASIAAKLAKERLKGRTERRTKMQRQPDLTF